MRAVLVFCLMVAPALALAVERIYEVQFTVRVKSGEEWAEVQLDLNQPRDFLRELRFRVDPKRHDGFETGGSLTAEGEYLRWKPGATGGSIRWRAHLVSRRSQESYDGWVNTDWAVFRGDDLVPPVATLSLKGARSRTRLLFEIPKGWSSITPYRKNDRGVYLVTHGHRNFDRPTGWMALGKLGVRWATIADTRVAVAGPTGQGLRRQDILALMRWTLPTLHDIFPDFGDRLLIVGAGDPMWRGGLSGPASLFIHADRPLISENGTSTLLHELVHVGTGLKAEPGADWIVEGMAEYYALEALVRSGTASPRRHRASLEDVADWGEEAEDLFVDSAGGEVTAHAVVVLDAVDAEIRESSGGKHSLDDVARSLAKSRKVSFERFRKLADGLAGKPVKALDPDRLPGSPAD